MDSRREITMVDKTLNEAETLSIKRLRDKGDKYADIALKIGISVDNIKAICKNQKAKK